MPNILSIPTSYSFVSLVDTNGYESGSKTIELTLIRIRFQEAGGVETRKYVDPKLVDCLTLHKVLLYCFRKIIFYYKNFLLAFDPKISCQTNFYR